MRHLEDIDLHAFVDEQVGASRRLAITALLDEAPVDAGRVALWRRQNDSIRSHFASVGGEPVPLWLTVGQIAKDRVSTPRFPRTEHPAAAKPVRDPGGEPIPSPGGRSLPTLVAIALLAFATGCFVPALVAAWPNLSFSQATKAAPLADEFAERAREAHDALTMRIADPAEVKGPGATAWLDRRLPFPASVPDLKQVGWSLLGARLVPGGTGPGALVIYDNALGDRLSLVMEHLTGVSSPARIDRHGVLVWAENGVGYAVATSQSEQYLERNGSAIAAAVADGQTR